MNVIKELKYFEIGKSYGGNQRWLLDPWMHIGGCGALTVCDVSIYLALHKDRKELYPYDLNNIKRRDYVRFAMAVKPYLMPRATGIKDLTTYINEISIYIDYIGVNDIIFKGVEGRESYTEAEKAVTSQIDAGMPLPYLMLKHDDKKFKFLEWHWFIINGYKWESDELFVKVVTYGRYYWLSLKEMWNTNYEEKGGIIKIVIDTSN